MNTQTKTAIIAIVIVIPFTSYYVWQDDSTNDFQTLATSEKLAVVTSFYPMYEFTKEIGGDKVSLSLLIPPGMEPHDWEPTVKDIQQIQQSDMIVINGLGFERWVDDIDNINSEIQIVDTSFGITPIRNNDEHKEYVMGDIDYDPHIWLNPNTIKIQVQNIAGNLKEHDPENAEYYTRNTQEYLQKIELLDKKIRNDISECSKRDFIAFHDAFSYFAKEYELNQHTVLKTSAVYEEATAQSLENIINLARELDIKIIFTEEFSNSKLTQVIANELGGKVLVLDPLEIEKKGYTFLDRLETNVENLKEALC
ncbi:metal ABC transporter substrate-binding protein [Nitrosopumilus piranensis]|uniref:Periplasmic solute binding protein n=1 Tax=Nitrosopumilus piranensis TaxID=1582439 RepID=A0A0C5C8T2_9ARCH|nr:zinc ABC transporter substrate-binding protein [Nitrosopumilus piranensis]AJM91617.1 Periplasmic solute binding protein [Nitrosopumilus piranensis]